MGKQVHMVETEDEYADGIYIRNLGCFPACGKELGDQDWAGTDDPCKVRCKKCREWMKQHQMECNHG